MARPNKPNKKKAPPKKNGRGRPSSFREEYSEQAKKLCRLGATDKEMADFFGVCEQTFNAWKKEFPQFLESLKEGKSQADAEVADRLFKRATGYSHPDTKFATFEGRITDSCEYIKHYAPDTIACIFWLKNRRPDLWRDKVGVEHTGKDGGPIQTEGDYRPTPEDELVLKRIAETRNNIAKPQEGE